MSRIVTASLAAVFLLAVACGEDSEPPSPLLGEWTGESQLRQFARANVTTGAEHCDTENILFLTLFGPAGEPEGVAWFVRDEEGLMRSARFDWASVEPFSTVPSIPATAVETGFSKGDSKLWLADGRVAAFVEADGEVERWPASPRNPGCD